MPRKKKLETVPEPGNEKDVEHVHPESEDDNWSIDIAPHPPRTESEEYIETRKTLMGDLKGACVICGDIPDMSHPELFTVGDPRGLEDHHGGGIWYNGILIGLNLFPIEWSEGWGANPEVIQKLVSNQNSFLEALNQKTYDKPIASTQDVMDYADSIFNANVKLCHVHHQGTPGKHTPDKNGHEAVGIHHIPAPIFWYQLYCDWDKFNMWGGSTGNIAVAPDPQKEGSVIVLHVAPGYSRLPHHRDLKVGMRLDASHIVARTAFLGSI